MHTPSMQQLETKIQLSETFIKHIFKAINIITIHYTRSILLHKRKIKKQPINTNRIEKLKQKNQLF